MKYIAYLIIPLVLVSLYGGCGGDNGEGNNISEEDQVVLDNLCFLLTAEDPCFDVNEGSETRNIDDMTIGEVISQEQSKSGFIKQLQFTEIFNAFRRSFFLPTVREGCSWDDSGLIIKNIKDWDNYRNNCYFTDNFFQLRDIDFSNNMVIISLKGGKSFGSQVVAVLEFENELVAIISDTVSDAPSSESGDFGSSAIEVERTNLPVSFIRVEDICNSFYNFSNSECLAESMANVCELLHCNSTNIPRPLCTAIDCFSLDCDVAPGIFTNLELDEHGFPIGIINVDGGRDLTCGLIVE